MILFVCIVLLSILIVCWVCWMDYVERDNREWIAARRAEEERRAILWLQMLEQRDEMMRQELMQWIHDREQEEVANWKEEGF